ncbi:MAG: aminotransferase class IV [Clostridiales bacterium]|nr:aminotransferase class IV [Clostridiales bacterium]
MLIKELLPQKPSEPIIYVNGECLLESQAKISVLDHGWMYGDGCFDAWCGKNGFIFQLDRHLERLYHSIFSLKIKYPMPYEVMREKIIETVHANALLDFYIKVLVSRGASPQPVMDPRQCKEPGVVIFARPTQTNLTLEKQNSGIRIKVVSIRRTPHEDLDPQIKSMNYLTIILGKMEAVACGFDEAVMLDHQGYVTECCGFNIFAIQGKKLFTASRGILKGITRHSVFLMAKDIGLEVEEGFYSMHDFINADEVFMTSTVGGVIPVSRIDDWIIADGKPGPYTRKFSDTYQEWLESGAHGTQVYTEAWK